MKAELTHLRVLTRNFDETLKFYRDTLGLEPKFEDTESEYVEFKTGNATLALFSCKNMAKAIGLEMGEGLEGCYEKSTIILRVDDVDSAYDTLKSKGVVFLAPPTDRKDWGVRTAHFRDPEGNLIEINQFIGHD